MEQIILFTFLVLFPFGQIIKIGIINPIDVVVGISATIAILKNYKKPHFFKSFTSFLFIATYSYILSIFVFKSNLVIVGLLYLIRLASYFYFFVYVYNTKIKVLPLLLSVSVISALFGWIQYLIFPDVRALIEYGWDDHLFRMVGTFLDPAFLGLILVLGLVISLHKKKNLISLFLLISIAFTYSRASYLAALIPLFQKKSWIFLLIFISVIFLLPRPEGEGVKLERVASISNRLQNYKETVNIFKTTPLFGVGYNNICLSKDSDFSSHSCSGSESSILFILATTGVVGLISFVGLVLTVWKAGDALFKTSALALLVHSFFANSLFYPWIMGWMIIFLGDSLRSKVKG